MHPTHRAEPGLAPRSPHTSMMHHRFDTAPSACAGLLAALVLTACSGSSSGGDPGPELNEDGVAPPSSQTIESAGGAVRVDWPTVTGADSYVLFWSETPGVDETSSSMPVPTPPAVIGGLTGTVYTRVASVDATGHGPLSKEASRAVELPSPERYFPSWGFATPKNDIVFDYNGGKTSVQNGADLAAMVYALQPGDRLLVGGGTYTMSPAFRIIQSGTATDPIWIENQPGETPIITRADANQNTIDIGSGGSAAYLVLRGFEITGGDIALRLHDANNVWIDQCDIHHCAQNAIAANSLDNEHLYFTRNEVHHTAGFGEGFYLGSNNGATIVRYSVVAMNHVHDTGGSQGDGIELKEGSYGNLIAENLVHDTNYPCILVGGTGGQPINVIERNVCYGSNDYTMQVQGDALVRNNAIFDGVFAFYSASHQGPVQNLTMVHNTIVNAGRAVVLAGWAGRPNMVFSNNACYSQTSDALSVGGGSAGVQMSGNVVYGSVYGATGGYTLGGGLSDFENANWAGTARDVTPTPFGALPGAADQAWAELDELDGSLRVPPYDTGAAEL